MRGHQQLINFRMQGYKPLWVYLLDSGADLDHYTKCKPDSVVFEIDISEDRPETLDLRFCFNLMVNIGCRSKSRARGFFEACKAHQPRFLTASYHKTIHDNLFCFKHGSIERISENDNQLHP